MNWHVLSLILLIPLSDAHAAPSPMLLSGQVPSDQPQVAVFALTLPSDIHAKLECLEMDNANERHVVFAEPKSLQQLTVRGLKAETTYTCQATQLDNDKTQSNAIIITTPPLPPDLIPPQIVISADNPANVGYTLYNVGNINYLGDPEVDFDQSNMLLTTNYLVILDAEGHIRWYLSGPGAGDVDSSYLGDGDILFGGNCVPNYPPTIVSLDYATKYGAQAVDTTEESAIDIFHHDVGLSQDGLSIYALIETDDDTSGLTGFAIKQYDISGQNMWEWRSADAIGKGQLSPDSAVQDVPEDPFHANSIWDRWESGTHYLYLSMRNNSQIIKIDRESGDVIWHLGYEGDFVLQEQDGSPADISRWFFNQHDVKVVGDRIIMHDNGYDRAALGGPSYTRLLQLELDESGRTARIVYEFTEEHWLEPFWGGYDRLPNGHSLIAMGHCHFCEVPEDHYSALVELNNESQIVWRAEFTHKEQMIYRADRISGCEIFNNAAYCPNVDRITYAERTDGDEDGNPSSAPSVAAPVDLGALHHVLPTRSSQRFVRPTNATGLGTTHDKPRPTALRLHPHD